MTQPQVDTVLGGIFQPLVLQAAKAAGESESAGGPPYEVPEWIALVPAANGSLLRGSDGRVFQMEDPEDVAEATRLPIVLDYEHGSVYGPFSSQTGKAGAPNPGRSAPAPGGPPGCIGQGSPKPERSPIRRLDLHRYRLSRARARHCALCALLPPYPQRAYHAKTTLQ